MKRIYLVPNMLTAFSLSCGLFIIFKVILASEQLSQYEILYTSTLLLIFAAIADLLDGAVARAMHAESEFGALFDSLADAVTFGVAPSVLFLKSLAVERGTWLYFFVILSAMLYSICGVLRLVRFNVKAHSEKKEESQKKSFMGLPIPAAGAGAVSVNLFLHSPLGSSWIPLDLSGKAITLACVMLFIGYLMISRWRFPALKTLHIKVPSLHLFFFTVVLAIALLYGVLYYFSLTFTVVTYLYILVGLLLSIIRKISGARTRHLEDFDPDE